MPFMTICRKSNAIPQVGKDAIGTFLLKLQVHKSLGDLAAGSSMYNAYSEVSCVDKFRSKYCASTTNRLHGVRRDTHRQVPEAMIAMREIVMARKEPRKLLVQPHMYASAESADAKVELKTFASTPMGMIESFVEVSEEHTCNW